MKKLIFLIISLIMAASYNISVAAITDPSVLDIYRGDTIIYGASTATLQPNVLIIFDNSGSMADTAIMGTPYTSSTTYASTNSCEGDTQSCDSAWVYKYVASGVEGKWTKHILLSTVYNYSGNNCRTQLNNTGQYSGGLSGATGRCGSNPNGKYAVGNWINWLNSPDNANYPKIAIAKKVVRELITSTSGVKFGMMNFNNNQGGFIAFNVQNMDSDNATLTSEEGEPISATQKSLLDIIGYPGVLTPSATDSTLNNFDNYSDDSPAGIMPSTWTPLAESLFEAMRYYSGGPRAFINNPAIHTSPIEYSCQKNYVILITDGMSTQDRDNVLQTICNSGDCDGDGPEVTTQTSNGSDYLDDVAWYMYNTDLLTDDAADAKTIGKQNVITYTIGFGLAGGDTEAVTLLSQAAQNGGGQAYLANDIVGLSDALSKIFANIMAENTSFVAPVVPVSPENKVYSGERVYIGFFKPSTTAFWSGNLKKYGLKVNTSNNLEITDKDGNAATNSDGSFKDNSISFWGTTVDGGQVEAGGVGIQLINRTTVRNLYTYLGTNVDLTDTSNAFTTTNAAITDTMLGAADSTERDKIIRYVHGEDSFMNSTNKRSWILGDILHSRPLVLQYNKYSIADESSCSSNKSIIYVGGNDGMLHAYKDCNGEELWGFIPPDKLGHLYLLNGGTHTYYVDGTPKAYIYDKNKDGEINTTDDKVVLIFGERRGGQYYYALDITDSANPKFMWRLAGASAGANAGLFKAGSIVGSSDTWYTELSETWSDPAIGKIKLGSSDKRAVMFISAGYDNDNEDLEPANPTVKGRGIYAVEIADISSGTPSFTNSGNKLWGYTNADNSNMTSSIPSTLSIVDVNDDTYIDRAYVGDAGGKLWKFNVSGAVSAWSGKLLFTSNSGADKRKIFYELAVTFEADKNNNPYEMLFFGTGDREHPIRTNTNDATNPKQVDRMYAVKDKAQAYTINESYLTDVTTDELQELPGTSTSQIECTLSKLGWQKVVSGCDEQDGWFIRLDQNIEEKVLAPSTVFNKGAYYTTYSPNTTVSTDVCKSGNEGIARVYGVNWRTGEAIINWDTSNDSTATSNTRAKDSQNNILLRSDRVKTVGDGIPSQVNIIIMPGGTFGLIGVGGSINTDIAPKGGGIIPQLWRELFF